MELLTGVIERMGGRASFDIAWDGSFEVWRGAFSTYRVGGMGQWDNGRPAQDIV